MRPVDKGGSPYTSIAEHSEAQEFLLDRLGDYCSYCEFHIEHVPHVEHVECKCRGGSKTDWNNLLLACTYCNSSKATKIGLGERVSCIWPDEHNTFLAFEYIGPLPKVNESYLKGLGGEMLEKAQKLYEVLDFGYFPGKDGKTKKDKRYQKRSEALGIAQEQYDDWCELKNTAIREKAMRNIKTHAKQKGFFSIWMNVFKDEPEIKVLLIEEFPGTAKKYFDENGSAIY